MRRRERDDESRRAGTCCESGGALVFPDTSSRAEGVADDDAYDLGQGAGFYIDATEAPCARHFRIESYMSELDEMLDKKFPVDRSLQAITGYSMGGHGALPLTAKWPGRFLSVSAFSPIYHPAERDWERKQFQTSLGSTEAGRAQDAVCLIQESQLNLPILINTGTKDQFSDLLKTEASADVVGFRPTAAPIRLQNGYDHSYFFASTFMCDHVACHAAAPNA